MRQYTVLLDGDVVAPGARVRVVLELESGFVALGPRRLKRVTQDFGEIMMGWLLSNGLKVEPVMVYIERAKMPPEAFKEPGCDA